MSLRNSRGGLMVAVLMVLMAGLASAAPAEIEHLERKDHGFYSLVDSAGNELLSTGLIVSVGDSFIDEHNDKYQVIDVKGDRALVEFVRTVDLGSEAALPPSGEAAVRNPTPTLLEQLSGVSPAQGRRPGVAIYHTHSDESYKPTDGTASIEGNGGIYKVGKALKHELEELGFEVTQDLTSHDPHDANAYHRSRRTAMKLLEGDPDVVLDIHRDTPPAEAYRRRVAGRTVTQVMLVVGRQNPKRSQTDAVARRTKAVVDEKYPGLIRGIFYGKGNYNQDLSSRLLVLEVGSFRNKREHAEEGVKLFAQAMPDIVSALGGAGGTMDRSAGRTLLGLVLLVLVGGAAYLYISTGSWEEAVAKLRRMTGREWGDLFRPGGSEDKR